MPLILTIKTNNMKKIMIIILLLVGLGSCDNVDQTNVTNVSHGLVLEARDKFESDSTINVVIIEKINSNYVFEKGVSYPILESYTSYNSNYLELFIVTVLLTLFITAFIFIR